MLLEARDEGLLGAGFYEDGQMPGGDGFVDQNFHPLLKEAKAQLEAYFDGGLQKFDLPLCPQGTAFQKKVWEQLSYIEYGHTTTYKAIATRMQQPTGMRAVGAANGRNPIAIIIPCHRVIGVNQALVGYAGGLWRKQFLLQLEGVHFERQMTLWNEL
jgi:methylated-DNA-[protein]-cysteine S-methyltransferase